MSRQCYLCQKELSKLAGWIWLKLELPSWSQLAASYSKKDEDFIFLKEPICDECNYKLQHNFLVMKETDGVVLKK